MFGMFWLDAVKFDNDVSMRKICTIIINEWPFASNGLNVNFDRNMWYSLISMILILRLFVFFVHTGQFV